MTPTPIGRRLLLLRAAALAGAAVLPLAAFAAPAHAAGDNGDVKIHDSGTPADQQADDPKVCKFYVDGLNFDAGQSVTWHIDQQPPTGTAQVLNGALLLPTGNARTADLSLPDGHYKLGWNFVGEDGDAKQKVFTVDCSGVGSSQSPSPSPSGSPVGTGTSSSPPPRAAPPRRPAPPPPARAAARAPAARARAVPATAARGRRRRAGWRPARAGPPGT
ncbi:hypothetical protein ACFQ2M_32500 [Kitasatospora saccharophila]|uniref:hypothetical protein n=1 Tax=Kitasatospora saccharophila TaxID=407973 RepID=UPI0036427BC9